MPPTRTARSQPRARDPLRPDPSLDEGSEVVEDRPLRREEGVEDPRVKVLEPVKPAARLSGRQAQERRPVDVVIHAIDVGVLMMDDVVLEVPEVRASADEVERPRRKAVSESPPRERAVPAVVLDVEADAGHRKPQRNRQGDGLPPRRGPEDKQDVREHQPGQDQRRLEIHPEAAVPAAPRPLEVRLDALQQRRPKGRVGRILDRVGFRAGGSRQGRFSVTAKAPPRRLSER